MRKGEQGFAYRFKAEDQDQQRNGRRARGVHRCNRENEAHEEVCGEHVSRLEGLHHHQAAGQETVERVQALRHGEEVRCGKIQSVLAKVHHLFMGL